MTKRKAFQKLNARSRFRLLFCTEDFGPKITPTHSSSMTTLRKFCTDDLFRFNNMYEPAVTQKTIVMMIATIVVVLLTAKKNLNSSLPLFLSSSFSPSHSLFLPLYFSLSISPSLLLSLLNRSLLSTSYPLP